MLSETSVDFKNWTCLIPAAGRGSRLQYNRPKILYPINGRPILYHLIGLFRAHCSSFVFVASPDGEKEISNELAKMVKEIEYKIVIQPEPTGMADAIWRAKNSIDTDFTVVVWGDQICLRETTICKTLEFHQSNPNNTLTFPTVWKKDPYIHFERNESGQIKKVLQAREGEINVDEGENDCGMFALRTHSLFDLLGKNRVEDSVLGAKTGEQNLLQLFPEFEKLGGKVTTLRIATEEETLGVNTLEDAKVAEQLLHDHEGSSEENQLRVVMFTGGRGAATLAPLLTNHPKINLSTLVNAYDDGLSTGRLRKFIPGFLGPSDFRKNIARLIPPDDPSNRALKYILEYRLPDSMGYSEAVSVFAGLYEKESPLLPKNFWKELYLIKYYQALILR